MRCCRENSVRRVGEWPSLGWTLLVITLLFFHVKISDALPLSTFNGNSDRDTKVIVSFSNPPTARYVRIFPRIWFNHPSMRAGLLIGQDTVVVQYERLEYSSTWEGDPKGDRYGQGMLNSSMAWSSLSKEFNQWFQMDAGQLKVINGVVTQGRHDDDQWVTSYFIQASMDGVTWHAAEGFTTCVDSGQSQFSLC
jgi:hypothetical protein